MALIGNGVLLRSNPFYGVGQAGVFTTERATFWDPGARRRFAYGQASISGVTNRAAVPEGYLHPACWDMPQKSGGIASRGRIAGDGETTSANLAGGLNAESDIVGVGDIDDAALGLILSAVATLVGQGVLTSSIVGVLQAAASVSGSGDPTAALGALASLVSDATGAGTISSASSTAKAQIGADIVVTGDVLNTANVAAAVWEAVAEGSFTYQQVMRILSAVAAGKTTIVDLGGGMATVTFRDLEDTKDRIVADMDGSERTDVTKDVS